MFPLLLLLLLAGCPTDPVPHSGTDTDDPYVDVDAAEDNQLSHAGQWALDFIRADPYDTLYIEVDWVTGHRPADAALDAVAVRIAALGDKPGGVEVLWDDEIPDQGSPTWSIADLNALELHWRDRYRDPDAGVAAMYLLFVDGHSDRDEDELFILGMATHASSVVMFQEVLEGSGGDAFVVGLDEAVGVHELGHIFGLVNNGVPMVEDHQDVDNGQHCMNPDCIMYWLLETNRAAQVLSVSAPDFDAACLADLEAVR